MNTGRAKHNPHPAISVIIPAYNEERFIERPLKSLKRQTFQDFEVIVVNNNCTDRTAEIAARLGATVIHESRPGVAFARQTGFLTARGSIVATTDADTILPSHWLETINASFQNNFQQVAFGGLYHLSSGPWTARLVFSKFGSLLWKLDKKIQRGWSLVGANMAVRKTAFMEIGGFNTTLSLGEDADLSQRLKTIGEVSLDHKLCVATSGRRYRGGLAAGMVNYLPHIFHRWIYKQPLRKNFKDIRKENPAPQRYALSAAYVFAAIFMIVAFYNAGIDKARAEHKRFAIPSRQQVFMENREMTHAILTSSHQLLHRPHWHESFLP